jgi:hypothetical protein
MKVKVEKSSVYFNYRNIISLDHFLVFHLASDKYFPQVRIYKTGEEIWIWKLGKDWKITKA